MNSCQIGSLTYTYAYYLQNGRKEADSLFCKLSWLIPAQKIIDGYIPVGTLISTPAVNACGVTNTEIHFAPIPPLVSFAPSVFNYNGNPLLLPSAPTLISFMDSVIAALTVASGVQWSYQQLSDWEFRLCAPYTQNGDTVDLTIDVYGETLLGEVVMSVTLAGGVAPETPARYQTADMNCITATQYNDMVETANWVTKNVKCCDIKKPAPVVCDSDSPSDSNIELRESLDEELREIGN